MKFAKSFYDWCIENNRQDLLDRWDYKLNKRKPQEIAYRSSIKCYFKCPKGIHVSEIKTISHISSRNSITECHQCNSFAQWCIDHNRKDVLNRWDYQLNKNNPFNIGYGSVQKYYFKCPKGIHQSELKCLNNFTNKYKMQEGSIGCNACNSFAQWGIDNICSDFLEKYWDYDKNKNINPWKISKSTKTKVYIKCIKIKYHDSYLITTNDFVNGKRCSYCSGRKIHKFDSLGWLYPESFQYWSDKNKKSPYEYISHSSSMVYWKCPNKKHNDYKRSIDEAVRLCFRCPLCTAERNESFLQEKVRLYIENMKYNIHHENNCTLLPINPKTKMPLPFDNEIEELKLIIEVNGSQHYKITNFAKLKAKRANTTPEYELHKQQLYDRYKKYVAYKNGYEYLAIPYWTDDKKETWKQMIDNKMIQIQAFSIKLESA